MQSQWMAGSKAEKSSRMTFETELNESLKKAITAFQLEMTKEMKLKMVFCENFEDVPHLYQPWQIRHGRKAPE